MVHILPNEGALGSTLFHSASQLAMRVARGVKQTRRGCRLSRRLYMKDPPTALVGFTGEAAGVRRQSTRVNCSRFDKAQRVMPFVFGIERSLAPGPDADAAS